MLSDSIMLNFVAIYKGINMTPDTSENMKNGALEIAHLKMPCFQKEGFESKSMHANLNFIQMYYWEHAISPSLLASSMKPRRLSVHHG